MNNGKQTTENGKLPKMNNGKQTTENGQLLKMNNGQQKTENGQLPPIDFRDISDIEGSASLILSMSLNSKFNIQNPKFQNTTSSLVPGFKIQHSKFQNSSAPVPEFKIQNSTFKIITKAAREWIKGVKGQIDAMPAGNAMRAAGCLDLMHRLAYGTPADSSVLDTYRLAAFDSFVRGDSSVDRYMLFNVVSSEVRQRNRRFLGKPLQWESLCIDRWHRQFRHGVSIDDLPDHDTVHRVTALLDSDLWAFETKNESRYKQTLFENHRHYLESIHNATPMHNSQCIMHNEFQNDRSGYELCIMNYELTNALQSFLLASTPYLSPEEYTTYDTKIREALIASKETNKFLKAALRVKN